MAIPLVSITLLNWNGRGMTEHAIRSVLGQRYPALELLVLDQNSRDGSRETVAKLLSDAPPHITATLKLLDTNIGFAAGHNALIREAKGEYIVCVNQDALLAPDFFAHALDAFSDENVAAVQPKILRYDFAAMRPKEIIDTAGLEFLRMRRIINRGQGEVDHGQYERQEEVFGADGAVPIYRKAALDDVALPLFGAEFRRPFDKLRGEIREFFDEDFFAYKEDVDLAWRLRLAGWKTIYRPDAVAFHGRGSGDSMARAPWQIIQERRKINWFSKYLSFRNQRLMQIKNEFPSLLLRDIAAWLPKEIGAWAYAGIFEGTVVPRALWDWKTLIPRALQKRKMIMERLRARPEDMARWFT